MFLFAAVVWKTKEPCNLYASTGQASQHMIGLLGRMI